MHIIGNDGTGKTGCSPVCQRGLFTQDLLFFKTSLHVHVLAADAARNAVNNRILRPHLATRNVFTRQQIPKLLSRMPSLGVEVVLWSWSLVARH
jgi:hypothetical protein